MHRYFLLLCLFASACSGNSTTSPASTTGTKIISVAGSLAFGNVNIGSSATLPFSITNSGTASLTFTSLAAVGGSGIAGYTASQTSGVIAPGTSQTVTVRFTPTAGQFYGTVLTVIGDQTAGNNAINASGTGINTAPIFAMNGAGNTVFTIPASVIKARITGTYTGFGSNFIVWIGGQNIACGVVISNACNLIVNDLIGTGYGRTVSDGTYFTGGATSVSIIDSTGVSWSFTEVR